MLTFVVIDLAACVLVTLFQRRMIYHPASVPAEVLEQMARAEGLRRWTNAAGAGIGWQRISRPTPAQGRVLVVHGNAGCAVDRSDYARRLQQVAPLDVFILEYPGYGDRPGSPSQAGFFQAADEALALLATNGPLYIVGESLGTGVAAYLAGAHPTDVAGLLLFAPFDRLAGVAQEHFRIFPVRWMLLDRLSSADHLQNYRGPVAVLLAGRDQVVPNKFGRRLFDGYGGPKKLWEFPEATHNSVLDQPVELWQEVFGFWQTNQPATNR